MDEGGRLDPIAFSSLVPVKGNVNGMRKASWRRKVTVNSSRRLFIKIDHLLISKKAIIQLTGSCIIKVSAENSVPKSHTWIFKIKQETQTKERYSVKFSYMKIQVIPTPTDPHFTCHKLPKFYSLKIQLASSDLLRLSEITNIQWDLEFSKL